MIYSENITNTTEENLTEIQKRVLEILKVFDKVYANAKCSLEFNNPFELLIATQLSAQCTDVVVNKVTKVLFSKYKNVYSFAEADIEDLEEQIKPTGFYRRKAKNIKQCCELIIREFNGNVPDNMEDMLRLPGVGRKTANVVLGDAYGIPGIVVDTHVIRLSNRMGFTENKDPVKIEYDLMEIVPMQRWVKFGHQFIMHGRSVCMARKPKCGICPVRKFCDFGNKSTSI